VYQGGMTSISKDGEATDSYWFTQDGSRLKEVIEVIELIDTYRLPRDANSPATQICRDRVNTWTVILYTQFCRLIT
jgi:hypothetical protein